MKVNKRIVVPAALVGVAVVVSGSLLLARSGSGSGEQAEPSITTASAAVRDLTRTETLNGVVAYQDLRELGAAKKGIITRLPTVGEQLSSGDVLMAIDEEPVVLLNGPVPAWRDMAAGVPDGADIKQLESSLLALGLGEQGPAFPDAQWDSATTEAVQALQKKVGAAQDGVLSLGEVVFTKGGVHIAKLETHVGALVTPDDAVLSVQSTDRMVQLELDPLKRDLIKQNAPVKVELPSGKRIPGKITEVSTTLEQNADGKSVYKVTVELDNPEQVSGIALAPVTVHYVAAVAKQVLSVPVSAIVGVPGGGYAVNVVDGSGTKRVPVEPGAWGDGYVAVSGDLSAGAKVEVPA